MNNGIRQASWLAGLLCAMGGCASENDPSSMMQPFSQVPPTGNVGDGSPMGMPNPANPAMGVANPSPMGPPPAMANPNPGSPPMDMADPMAAPMDMPDPMDMDPPMADPMADPMDMPDPMDMDPPMADPMALPPVDVAVEGPYQFDTFTEGAKAPEYAQGLVYYPTDADGPFPVMVLSPGYTASNTDYEIWGRVLASHGIVALLLQPTNVLDRMPLRADDLEAGVGVAKGALNESGPLAGKIRTDAIGIMGQSMGGGGTLIAANRMGDQIQAVMPLQPYEPGSSFSRITAPTMVIAAEDDTVAGVRTNAYPHYESIPDSTTKIYVEVAGADHYLSTDRNEDDFGLNARYAIAFLKVYLEQDMRYEGYLYGAEHDEAAGELSRYLTSQTP